MSLEEQIAELYLAHADWAVEKMPYEKAVKYFRDVLKCGRLISISDGDKLIGYGEFRVDTGVCFIDEVIILPEYRGGRAIWKMTRRLKELTNAKVFLGERFRNNSRIEVVTRR